MLQYCPLQLGVRVGNSPACTTTDARLPTHSVFAEQRETLASHHGANGPGAERRRLQRGLREGRGRDEND